MKYLCYYSSSSFTSQIMNNLMFFALYYSYTVFEKGLIQILMTKLFNFFDFFFEFSVMYPFSPIWAIKPSFGYKKNPFTYITFCGYETLSQRHFFWTT